MNTSFLKGFACGAFAIFLFAAPMAISQQPKPAAPAPKPATAAPAAPRPAAAPAAAVNTNNCKVAFVNLARVLDQAKQGVALKAQLDAERNKQLAPLKAKQAEMEKLEKQITALQQEIIQKGAAWDAYTLAGKRNELDSLRMKYSNMLNDMQLQRARIQDSLSETKGKLLQPLEDKLNAIMEDIGAKGGYCLVMDVSPPSANMPNFNPILYRNPAYEITDQVIKALDAGK
jgi:Skp family chaperone for outer membrane proteins